MEGNIYRYLVKSLKNIFFYPCIYIICTYIFEDQKSKTIVYSNQVMEKILIWFEKKNLNIYGALLEINFKLWRALWWSSWLEHRFGVSFTLYFIVHKLSLKLKIIFTTANLIRVEFISQKTCNEIIIFATWLKFRC